MTTSCAPSGLSKLTTFTFSGNRRIDSAGWDGGSRSHEGLRIPFRATHCDHCGRKKIELDDSSAAARATAGRGLAVGQRRCSCAHELWRRVSQYAHASGERRRQRKTCRLSKTWWSTRNSEFLISRTSAPKPDPASTAIQSPAAWPGISYQLLGTPRPAQPHAEFHPAGLCCLSRHRRSQLVSRPTQMWQTWRMQQHGVVGYVHPYDSIPDPVKDASRVP